MTRILLPCLMLASATAFAGTKLTFDELLALEKAGSYVELLEHVEDIPPATRDAKWQALVEKAAGESLGGMDAAKVTGALEGLLRRYPFLKKSAVFSPARTAATLKALTSCYEADDPKVDCSHKVLTLLEGDRALALQVGKAVTHKQFVYLAVPMFKKATEGAYDKAICEDDDLLRSVAAALELPRTHAMVADAREITKACSAEVLDMIEAKLGQAADDSPLAKNTCDILKTRNKKLTPHPCP